MCPSLEACSIAATSADGSLTTLPTFSTTSPARKPLLDAGLSGSTADTSTPLPSLDFSRVRPSRLGRRRLVGVRLGVGLLLFDGHGADGELDLLLLAAAHDRHLGRLAGRDAGDATRQVRGSFTGSPSSRTIASPILMPALSAGEFAVTSATSAPCDSLRPALSAISSVTGWICTPSQPRVTEPLSFRSSMTCTASCWNGEADADRAARRREDRGVDADHFAIEIERRTAGIAAIDRRIDLQEVVIRAIADIAAAGRDNAGGDGTAKPERVADGDHPVADARLLRREIDIGVPLSSTLSSARSVFGVGADDPRLELAVIGELDGDLAALHHMVVGDDIAVIGDEEARALSRAAAPRAPELERLATEAAPRELLEELTERAVRRQVRHRELRAAVTALVIIVALDVGRGSGPRAWPRR